MTDLLSEQIISWDGLNLGGGGLPFSSYKSQMCAVPFPFPNFGIGCVPLCPLPRGFALPPPPTPLPHSLPMIYQGSTIISLPPQAFSIPSFFQTDLSTTRGHHQNWSNIKHKRSKSARPGPGLSLERSTDLFWAVVICV